MPTMLRSVRPVPFYPPVEQDSLSSDDVDKILANEMSQLSVTERERILADIHGVPELIEETPEFLDRCLVDMAAYLRDVQLEQEEVDGRYGAYQMALSIDASYATGRTLWLKFIRAAEYDAQDAAERLLAHFRHKLELFGESKLTKDITIQDLDQEEVHLLSCGYMTMLHNPDRAGRYICMERTEFCPNFSWSKGVRAMWFASMMGAEHEDVQRRGVVGVVYGSGNDSDRHPFKGDMLKNMASFQYAIPLKVSGLHMCIENAAMTDCLKKIGYFLERSRRLRVRTHIGSFSDNQLALRSFGIPVAETRVPVFAEAKMMVLYNFWHLQKVQNEIARRKQRLLNDEERSASRRSTSPLSSSSALSIELLEETSESSMGTRSATTRSPNAVITDPQPSDVLCGRGDSRKHPGNLKMHRLVQEHIISYQHQSKAGKTDLVKYIVRCIQEEDGGRFLKRSDDCQVIGWVELEENLAHEKVSKLFRRYRTKT